MGQELLFRGQNAFSYKWVIGSLILRDERPDKIMNWGGCKVEVLTSTIGQYIGLKDKNDDRIFTGDVIKFLLAPKELEWDSPENMFGTEPQVSWQECTKATRPILASAEVFFDTSNACYSLRNIKCYVFE